MRMPNEILNAPTPGAYVTRWFSGNPEEYLLLTSKIDYFAAVKAAAIFGFVPATMPGGEFVRLSHEWLPDAYIAPTDIYRVPGFRLFLPSAMARQEVDGSELPGGSTGQFQRSLSGSLEEVAAEAEIMGMIIDRAVYPDLSDTSFVDIPSQGTHAKIVRLNRDSPLRFVLYMPK